MAALEQPMLGVDTFFDITYNVGRNGGKWGAYPKIRRNPPGRWEKPEPSFCFLGFWDNGHPIGDIRQHLDLVLRPTAQQTGQRQAAVRSVRRFGHRLSHNGSIACFWASTPTV